MLYKQKTRVAQHNSFLLVLYFCSMAPLWGLSTPRAPKQLFQKIIAVSWSRNRICSYGFTQYFTCAKLYPFLLMFPQRAGPIGPQNTLKTKTYFGAFFPICCSFNFWEALGAVVPWCHNGAIHDSVCSPTNKAHRHQPALALAGCAARCPQSSHATSPTSDGPAVAPPPRRQLHAKARGYICVEAPWSAEIRKFKLPVCP